MTKRMKRKAARVALGLLITKSPVSNCTKKSTTNQIVKKKQKTKREEVQSTADKQKNLSKEIVQSSVKKRVIENRKTSKTAVRGRSRERSSSVTTESNSKEEEENTDDDDDEEEEEEEEDKEEEEEEEQPRKKFKKDEGRSSSTRKDFSRVQPKHRRRLTRSAVRLQPKLSTWLLQKRRHLRDRGTRLLRKTSKSNGQQTGEGREGGVKGLGGRGKESSGRGGGGGKEKPGSDNGTRESEDEKEENLQPAKELQRQSCVGNVENGVLTKELVVEVCQSENQSQLSNCIERRISKVSNSKKPHKDMIERSFRRLEIRMSPLKGSHVEWQNQRLDDDVSVYKNQQEEKEEEKYEEEEEGKEIEKEEKRTGEGEMNCAVLRGVSVALTDIGDYTKSKAQGQTRLETEVVEEKNCGAGSGGKPDPCRQTQRKNHSTEVIHPAKGVISDELEVIINSDDDDDDCHKDDDNDDDDVICVSSSSAQNLSSAARFRMNGLHRWTRWNRSRSRPLSRSSAPTHDSGIQLLEESMKTPTESLSQMPAVDILGMINKLQESFTKMKNNYENKLREKDELIRRLKDEPNLQVLRLRNELDWKTQQIEELNQIAERNVEIEAKISHLLSDRNAYDEELERLAQMETFRLGDDDFVVVENKVTSSEEEEQEEEETRKKRRRRKRKLSGGEEEEEAKDEANEIEELLVGLKETSEDVSFALSVPQPSSTSTDSVVPEPRPLPQKARDAVGDEASTERKGRHEIRRLVTKLSEETKAAALLEAERRERVKRERLKHLVVMKTDEATGQQVCRRLVLAFHDDERKMPWVEVNAQLLSQLKLHQVEAVEFMWDSVVESMERLKEGGTGCILAHCMGLGKTLSVISLLETLLNSDIGFSRCLIVAPLNAVLNWVSEWEKWVKPEVRPPVFDLALPASNQSRADVLKQWSSDGGILIVGYSLFRILVSYRGRSRRLKSIFNESLIDPGPDLVVCDEGHILKNDSSAISKCLNRISTKRRIILTGTPLQNNLIEYHCMVNFVRPHLLGTRVEFMNRFSNPITNGQHLDSTSADVQLMKRRAHVLHQMLTGCIHRRDYSTLVKFLPPKHEFVIAVRLSQRQIDLYRKYLDLCHGSEVKKVTGAAFFSDYQNLMRVWTHPWLLRMDQIRQQNKPLSFSDDDELESLIYTSSSSEEEEEEMEEENKQQEQEEEEEEKNIEQGTELAEERRGGQQGVQLRDEESKVELENKEAEDGRKADQLEKIKQMEKEEEEEETIEAEETVTAALISSLLNGYEEDRESSWSGGEGDGKDSSEDVEESAVDPVEERSMEDDGKTTNGTECGAKVIAGEVIRNWQTKTRSKGPVEEEQEVVPLGEEMWWSSLLSENDHLNIELGGKIVLLFEILRLAENIGDKVLVFSQSLLSLDLIGDFLKLKTDEATQQSCTTETGFVGDAAALGQSVWIKDEDYLRMDGSTGANTRKRLTANFNDTNNTRLRLFLISTKAGGLGINLDSANRVIIFDASWNPSHDIQSIFRVYRFGQSKPVFVYRFLAQGTMEEKIYDRQVIKETLSHRVIDEQQINRHFTAADLSQLYAFNPDQMDNSGSDDRPMLPIPKDFILMELLSQEEEIRRWIVEYHDHDSLLERRPEEDLTDDERRAAWEEYEHERQTATTIYNPHATVLKQPSPGAALQPVIDLSPSTSKTSSNTSVSGNLLQQPSTQALSSSGSTQMTTTQINKLSDDIVDLVTGHLPPHLKTKLNFQMSHLPRVIQEIIRYNPDITLEDLQQRINAFIGINVT